MQKITPIIKKKPQPTIHMIDLCAGTGAFTHAFEKNGKVKVVFANDKDPNAKVIYDENFSHTLTLGDLDDIKLTDIPAHDILTAGIPCQPFSIAGHQQGFKDPRTQIFWKTLEIIKHHQPKCIIIENVRNLSSQNNGDSFEIVKKNLIQLDYHLVYDILNTAEITGIPQHRERLYIVGFKSAQHASDFKMDFPKIHKNPISQYLLPSVDPKYYYSAKSQIWSQLEKEVTKHDTIYQFRRVYVRENKSGECPTLTANMGEGGHNVPIIKDTIGIRKLTPRECFNLQGFPATYKLPQLSDSKLYKLAGNAVTVNVVELLAEKVIKILT